MKAILTTLTLAALLASPRPVHAGPEEDQTQAEKLVQDGLIDARAGRYREAVVKFEAAFKLYPRPEIQHNLARAHEELKEYKQAHAHFSKALQQDYTFAEDGRKRLVAIEDVLRKTHAFVTVKSTPSQVRLVLRFSDGSEETHTSAPLETWAPSGALEVTASNPRFQTLTERRELTAGKPLSLDMVLKPVARRGFVEVTVSRPGASIKLSGQLLGRSPLGAQPWNVGTHSLEVSLDGYRSHQQDITIEADEVASIDVELEALSREDAQSSGDSPWVGWTVGSLGLVGSVTALILQFGKALPLERESLTHKNDTDPTQYNRLLDRAYTYETAAIVTGVTSALLVGTGLYLILSHEDEPGTASRVTLEPTVAWSRSAPVLGGLLRF